MAKKPVIKVAEKAVPPGMVAFAQKKVSRIEEIFPGDQYSGIRESLKTTGTATVGEIKVSADFDAQGNVIAMAAAVPRTPTKSVDYLRSSVPDFTVQTPTSSQGLRRQTIALYKSITANEGAVNNAIKKTASLVSQEGSFQVRAARQGKRPKKAVESDLLTLLSYWAENVNSNDLDSVVTGSRGIRQIVRRGGRQAMVEGDCFLRQIWTKTKVPVLTNASYSLPMVLQAMSAGDVQITQELFGTGFELYYWAPDASVINQMLNSRDPNVKKIADRVVDSKTKTELRKNGKVLLDPALLIHIKNGGTDTDAYGQSMVESAMTDLAYSRALKALDFVTIDSLINRMLIIKIGDSNEKSDYHNLAVAQARVNVFRKLLTDIGPNMMVVWAGHDIEKLDVGAHDALLDTTDRHTLAREGVKLSMGVPDAILTGSSDGGRAAAWAGFISLAAVADEMKEEWTQAITQLGKRIAIENNFQDADVIWQFNKTLLADKEANSKIMIQGYDRGLLSRRSLVEELGKDYDSERDRKMTELDLGDDQLFAAPLIPKGGPGGIQGTAPGSQPGRPPNAGNPDKVGPDRNLEDKSIKP